MKYSTLMSHNLNDDQLNALNSALTTY